MVISVPGMVSADLTASIIQPNRVQRRADLMFVTYDRHVKLDASVLAEARVFIM